MTVQSKTAARPSSVTTGPIAGSRKIYTSPAGRPDIAVPFREIALDPTAREEPYRAYDTSGSLHRSRRHHRPRSRPAAGARRVDRQTRLRAHRRPRGEGRGQRRRIGRPSRPRLPGRASGARRQAGPACHAVRIRPRRHRHGRDDLRRAPGEPRPAEGAGRCRRTPRRRRGLRRRDPRVHHPRIRPRRDRPRPRHHPRQHQPPGTRAGHHRPQLPGEDQRQHRQLRRHLGCGGGSGEAGVGDPLGRRHGDGPLHRPQHPQHPRLDPAQLAGADRHRADLPGAGEGRRRTRQARLGGVQGHADRAGRAGRRLLHHPCRRAARLRAADREARHRHRLARRFDHGALVPVASQGELPLRALRRDLRHHAQIRRVVLAGRRAASRLAARMPTTRRSSPNWRRWAS